MRVHVSACVIRLLPYESGKGWLLTEGAVFLQSNPTAVSRGVSQPERVSEEPPDLFSEEEAHTNATTTANGVHSDDDNDLFAG